MAEAIAISVPDIQMVQHNCPKCDGQTLCMFTARCTREKWNTTTIQRGYHPTAHRTQHSLI